MSICVGSLSLLSIRFFLLLILLYCIGYSMTHMQHTSETVDPSARLSTLAKQLHSYHSTTTDMYMQTGQV